ncbi:unnamed protein product [Linum tenue]|uniref:Fe2OG dioxygenase domain-containing protein n=1 Tax=Linum tenue TaxID=586396 RepID=A0AAV0RN68_9ROSI|nr:unnamed protein product [Linum tenue]
MAFSEKRENNGAAEDSNHSRLIKLREFDDTKLGVKGLVDAAVAKVPEIFRISNNNKHQLPSDLDHSSSGSVLTIPVIYLKHPNTTAAAAAVRREIVGGIRGSCEEWGFFQVVNHGIPEGILDEMIQGVRRFHELDPEIKKRYYTRDLISGFFLVSNFDLYRSAAASWRDTMGCVAAPDLPPPEQLPDATRDILIEYSKQVKRLSKTILELLSEALGLEPNRLNQLGCGAGQLLLGHYYPACPEPEVTIGVTDHTDASFITILLQDQIGGLQVLHRNKWVDVQPRKGALVVNLGDLLQFISVSHRVVPKRIGPRISVACFLRPLIHKGDTDSPPVYGPIPELLSEENPPVYVEADVREFMRIHSSRGLDEPSPLQHFRV